MMKDFFKFLLILSFSFSQSISKDLNNNNNINSEDKLLFVWQHFRHGARGPYVAVDPKTNLDFIGETWDGIGELTPLGMRMHYLLGISSKKSYSNFLSKTFNPNELYIVSTNVNRTINSVYSFLQGFYDNMTSTNLTDTQIDRSNILNANYSEKINIKRKELDKKMVQGGNTFIPVQIFDKTKLEFGLYDVKSCPGIDKYKKKNQQREEVIKIYDEIKQYTNDTFGEYVFKFMNITKDPGYLWNKTNLYYLSDTFVSDYFDGRKMDYINNTGINMDKFYNNSFNVTYIDTYHFEFGIPSTETVYISVSPIVRNMLHYADLRIDLDKKGKPDEIISNSPRFVIISGHDTSLAPMDIFMESEFGIKFGMATYGSNQIFELWKNGTTGNYSIRYLYNQKEKGVYDFDTFKEKALKKLYTPEQIKKLCQSTSNIFLQKIQIDESLSKEMIYFSIIIFCILSAIFFIIFGLIKLVNQIKKEYNRKNLNNINTKLYSNIILDYN